MGYLHTCLLYTSCLSGLVTSTRLGRGIINSHVRTVKVLVMGLFAFQDVYKRQDVERGERGSTEEHLTVTQFKVQREQIGRAHV